MNDGTAVLPARNVELGASGEEFQNLHEFVRKARSRLNQNAWDYIVGAAETETTMRRNRMSLDEIAFRPRVLRNVAKVDASVEAFGRKMRLPVVLAPVGALEIFDPNSAAAVMRGAGRFGITLSRADFALRTDDQVAYGRLVAEGAGVGFVARYNLRHWPGVVAVLPELAPAALPCWLAVHREIRANALVRTVYDFLARELPRELRSGS